MLKRLLTVPFLCSLLICGSALYAQEKVDSADLSYEERQVLQQLESQWDDLTAERQLRLRRGANRWQQMQPQERSQAQEQQQQLINQRFQRFNGLNRDDQIQLRNIQRRYQTLPAEQRQILREQFEKQAQQAQRNQPLRNNESLQNRDTQRRVQEVLRQNQNVVRPNVQRPQQVRPNTPERPQVTIPR
ncbi:MAG: DUF3106 domain-containing protein [Gammaproteobacteria bacterium]|nr:DUF3106 domain-containing protein [Gammaproteobacteria bacterium]